MNLVLGILGGFIIGITFPAIGLPLITEGVLNTGNLALLIVLNFIWAFIVNFIICD